MADDKQIRNGAMFFARDCTLKFKDIPLPILDPSIQYPAITHAIEDQFIRMLQRKEILLPNFKRKEIATIDVYSDYAGDEKGSTYKAYSFLLAAHQGLAPFLDWTRRARERHGLLKPYREISFKEFRYGPIQRALEDWLIAANNFINGIIFTFLIHKDVISVFGPNNKTTLADLDDLAKKFNIDNWRPKQLERLFRIVHPIGYLLGLLSREGQKIFWMTDNDSIIANKQQEATLGEVFQNICYLYAPHKNFDLVGYATPFERDPNSPPEYDIFDCLSIPDVVAGSLAHYYNKLTETSTPLLKAGVEKVLQWHCDHGVGLKKHAMIARLGSDGRLVTSYLSLKAEKEPDRQNIVYLHLEK